MSRVTRPPTGEREMQLLREAIAMVAIGAAPRVVVAGIHHAAVVVDPARRLAIESGVRLNLLRLEHDTADLMVEPPHE